MTRPACTSALLLLAWFGSVGYAFAASPSATPAQCEALQKQFDAAPKDKVRPDKLKKAQSQREHGADFCAQGKLDNGVKALKSALKGIGVQPAA